MHLDDEGSVVREARNPSVGFDKTGTAFVIDEYSMLISSKTFHIRIHPGTFGLCWNGSFCSVFVGKAVRLLIAALFVWQFPRLSCDRYRFFLSSLHVIFLFFFSIEYLIHLSIVPQ